MLKKIISNLFILPLLLFGNNAFAENIEPTATESFPVISGKNLENKDFNLPQSFEGRLNLIFVAFKREQQQDINKWLPLAKSLEKEYKDLKYYELPVLSDSLSPIRWIIDGGMRNGIPDLTAREKTITLYTNKKKFTESLNIKEEKDIQILLLDSQGKILWREKGFFSSDKEQSLKDFLPGYSAK